MRVIRWGSTVAAGRTSETQQVLLAETDRVRRDLLEDLLAGRDVSAGPKQVALRRAGIRPAT